jgi:hypothetical protein
MIVSPSRSPASLAISSTADSLTGLRVRL